ncbi:hypothetical protein [Kingella potus]|uniref:hypothetical protein n=1 Tax=Kingella potus TaxID=265175 RepID=UPI0011C05A18|nr:hypothetical protein [Kingella potus]UOP00192.1 hypothetical protein LVJ84_09650 [Kingella potus]
MSESVFSDGLYQNMGEAGFQTVLHRVRGRATLYVMQAALCCFNGRGRLKTVLQVSDGLLFVQ